MKKHLTIILLSIILIANAQNGSDFKKLHKTIEKSEKNIAKQSIWDFVDKFQLETTLEKLEDGIYVGKSPEDNDGYFHRLNVEVKDGRVIKANYDEIKIVKKSEVSREKDSLYCAEMEEKIGISPIEVFRKYEKQLILRQDVSRIDVQRDYDLQLFRFQLVFFDILVNKNKE